ncbi:hypothetical protein [Agaribacterium sp. ZY112]|uniref:hypothetical protein n=1 Tax=Agaribacterium sp. ZY112 TaxID=3233574 RepID=UPI00352588A7
MKNSCKSVSCLLFLYVFFSFFTNASPSDLGVEVSLLEKNIIDSPPTINVKDIETLLSIKNTSMIDFEFSYLRAVYIGDDEPLSTSVYFNAHYQQDENGADSESAYDEEGNAHFTVAGALFFGDFYNKETIAEFNPSHQFQVEFGESYVVSTESGGTHIGDDEKYSDKKLLLEFLDENAVPIYSTVIAL